MSDSQDNQFSLAQYVVAFPEKVKKYNLFDANPVLENLPACLLGFTKDIISSDKLLELPEVYKHPNQLYQALATKADEFYPGRTVSDLLIKQQICKDIFDAFIQALSVLAKERLMTMDPLTRSRLIVDLLTRMKS